MKNLKINTHSKLFFGAEMVKTSSELKMKTAKLKTRKAEEAKRNKIDRIYNRYNDSSTMNYSKGNSY